MKLEILGYNGRTDTFKYTADGVTREVKADRIREIQEFVLAEEPVTDEEMCLAICDRDNPDGDLLGATAQYP